MCLQHMIDLFSIRLFLHPSSFLPSVTFFLIPLHNVSSFLPLVVPTQFSPFLPSLVTSPLIIHFVCGSNIVHLDVVRDQVCLEYLHLTWLAEYLRVLPLLGLFSFTALLQLWFLFSDEKDRALCILRWAARCRRLGRAMVLGVLHGFG